MTLFSQLLSRNFRLAISTLMLMQLSLNASAQSLSLFDDQVEGKVKIWLPADSMSWLYANPLNTQYLQAKMVYEDGTYSDTIAAIGFRLRGNSSRFAAKKSFKISFNEFVPGRRYQGVKKLNLNGQHNDPTMVREKFFYHIWNKAGLPERRTVFLRLYVNNQYMGLYTGLEELDKDWLQRSMGENSGNLYKCTYPADLDYLGTDQQAYKSVMSTATTGGRAYSLETNESLDDYSGFVQLCSRLNEPVTDSFSYKIEAVLEVENLLKAYALDIACGNWDDYAYNKNNFCLYQHGGDGRFRFITYDTDNTFGVDWLNVNWATRPVNSWFNPFQSRPLVKKLLEFTPYRVRFYQHLDSLTRFVLHPDSCNGWLNWAKSKIYLAAQEDQYRTLDYGYSMNQFNLGFTGTVDGHTPYGIKPFLQIRYNATLAQLAVTPLSEKNRSEEIVLFPLPFYDELFFYLPGAEIREAILVDATGRSHLVNFSSGNFPGTCSFHSEKLKSGVYTLIIRLKNGDCINRRVSKN